MSAPQAPASKLLTSLMSTQLPRDKRTVLELLARHLRFSLGITQTSDLTELRAYQATAMSVRDYLIETMLETQKRIHDQGVKQVSYLSIEFLLGRALQNALLNLNLEGPYADALRDLGVALEDVYEEECDAGLGNGGLGRLAACFLDSLASLDYPAWGYGLRYTFGLFRQEIRDGAQAEVPDIWLAGGVPWELERRDVTYNVRFYGYVTLVKDRRGAQRSKWVGGEEVLAVAHDQPIPGFRTRNTVTLRLWAARQKPARELDLAQFNAGEHLRALEPRSKAEYITAVLYPSDHSYNGKELRLKQQYFFCSATLQDIIARTKAAGLPLGEFASRHAIQLNDTHPSLAIPELMRILVDEEGLAWDDAWNITAAAFAYTNHTVLPEALECWEVPLLEQLLPRHLQIIYEINHKFLQSVVTKFGPDFGRMNRMSLIEEATPKKVRMANLSIVGSHTVNGVAAIHSNILSQKIFSDFAELTVGKFQNKTNGVTPRRWIHQANRQLSTLVSTKLGSDAWLTDLSKLVGLKRFVDDPTFQAEWRAIKSANKQRLARTIQRLCQVTVDPTALFDIQVKRIHEYKRQLLNILGVIYRYIELKSLLGSLVDPVSAGSGSAGAIGGLAAAARREAEKRGYVPRVVVFGGKAAPGYYKAKLVIKLINAVAAVVNNDAAVGDLLKVVFIPNYSVSLAEIIIPASDISEHISTAGTEASGTGNMKFVMNGGLVIGTLDGANIEIHDNVGKQNIFIFGATEHEVDAIRRDASPALDERLYAVLNEIRLGRFGPMESYKDIIDPLWQANDYYLTAHDFASYVETHTRIDEAYRNTAKWTKMSIESTAMSGFFSSDRTIRQYADEIWKLKQCRIEGGAAAAEPRATPATSTTAAGTGR